MCSKDSHLCGSNDCSWACSCIVFERCGLAQLAVLSPEQHPCHPPNDMPAPADSGNGGNCHGHRSRATPGAIHHIEYRPWKTAAEVAGETASEWAARRGPVDASVSHKTCVSSAILEHERDAILTWLQQDRNARKGSIHKHILVTTEWRACPRRLREWGQLRRSQVADRPHAARSTISNTDCGRLQRGGDATGWGRAYGGRVHEDCRWF